MLLRMDSRELEEGEGARVHLKTQLARVMPPTAEQPPPLPSLVLTSGFYSQQLPIGVFRLATRPIGRSWFLPFLSFFSRASFQCCAFNHSDRFFEVTTAGSLSVQFLDNFALVVASCEMLSHSAHSVGMKGWRCYYPRPAVSNLPLYQVMTDINVTAIRDRVQSHSPLPTALQTGVSIQRSELCVCFIQAGKGGFAKRAATNTKAVGASAVRQGSRRGRVQCSLPRSAGRAPLRRAGVRRQWSLPADGRKQFWSGCRHHGLCSHNSLDWSAEHRDIIVLKTFSFLFDCRQVPYALPGDVLVARIERAQCAARVPQPPLSAQGRHH